jgi:hypothetical protein
MKKLQIVETVNYVLAVSDEEIRKGNYMLSHSQTVCQAGNSTLVNMTSIEGTKCKLIVAHQPKGNAPELDLPLLPEIVIEDDIRKLALTLYKEPLNKEGEIRTQLVGHGSTPFGFNKWFKSFKTGYKASTKRFSEDDLKKAIITGIIKMGLWQENEPNVTTGKIVVKQLEICDEIIQSLKIPKTPKWFVAEMERVRDWDKRDINGDYEAKLQFKTTTINNKTYLVGHYEF